MPPSQLKRLKASLREQGIVGPQQSKKQKKQNAQNGANKEKRVHRTEVLNTIRDQFNPFEYKWSKGPKFDATTIKNAGSKGNVVGRPYIQKSRAEEQVQNGILLDRQNRNKVGGIQDRRFGENDPTMDPETKMLQRSTELAQRRNRHSTFDLEDDEPGELTHMGQSLSLDGPNIKDDFDEDMEELSDADDQLESASRKRRRESDDGVEVDEEEEEEEDRPERKKSKQEVMKEVMAKSKLYKYERQAAKDEDEDLREELDKDFQDIHALLRGLGPKPPPALAAPVPGMNPERAALLNGTDKAKFEKGYDVALKKMAQEKRSIPSERTKTEEEIARETTNRLRDLEEQRLRRMRGDREIDDEEEVADDELEENDEFDDFGLGAGMKSQPSASLGADDEDEFLIEDGLVASGSDVDQSEGESSEDASDNDLDDGEDTEFFKSLEKEGPGFLTGANGHLPEREFSNKTGLNGNLTITFECPETHEEFLEVTKGVPILELQTFIQRVRLQYDAKLNSENKAKLGRFVVTLIDHISYLANQPNPPPFSTLETIIRHIHSMARTSYPLEVSNSFIRHLKEIYESRALLLTPGDLIVLTAIGTIFPTSDHFHQVVTPAILTMGRYLGLKVPQKLSDYALGAYLCTLCLQYQKTSKRYVPEVMNFIQNTLCVLAPAEMSRRAGHFPYHEPKTPVRIDSPSEITRLLLLHDCVARDISDEEESPLKLAILETNLKLIEASMDTWKELPAFFEIFEPILRIVEHLGSKGCRTKFPKTTQNAITKLVEKVNVQLKSVQSSRRPLELHHHRPLAIKMAIPKFEESYNPDKHYDPDRERTEASKLRKEFKREKKGAIRDLRKEGKVVARQNLREKKEKDAAYEKKYKRLIAEIQGEEGKEAKAYEREKEWRKKGKK